MIVLPIVSSCRRGNGHLDLLQVAFPRIRAGGPPAEDVGDAEGSWLRRFRRRFATLVVLHDDKWWSQKGWIHDKRAMIERISSQRDSCSLCFQLFARDKGRRVTCYYESSPHIDSQSCLFLWWNLILVHCYGLVGIERTFSRSLATRLVSSNSFCQHPPIRRSGGSADEC